MVSGRKLTLYQINTRSVATLLQASFHTDYWKRVTHARLSASLNGSVLLGKEALVQT